MAISACLAFVLPGVLAALSIAIPSRARSVGFSMGSVFVLAGMLTLPLIATVGDTWGMRWGMTLMIPMFVIGGLVIALGRRPDPAGHRPGWSAAAARAEVLHQRRQGRAKMLLVRGLNVSYGDVQVLFDVDFEVDDGEIVALLGTNGAGKSTLLKAIAGWSRPKGTVVYDGRDITYAPAHEIAPRGVVLVPGGQGVFPSLTVAENLRTAGGSTGGRRSGVAGRDRGGPGALPGPAGAPRRPGRPTCRADSSRCSPSAMAFLSRPPAGDDRRAVAGPGAGDRRALVEIVRRIRDKGRRWSWSSSRSTWRSRWPRRRTSWRRARCASTAPRRSCSNGLTCCARCSWRAAAGARLSSGNGAAGRCRAGGRGEQITAAPSAAALADRLGAAGPALEVGAVTRSFGGVRAVDDVSFAVAPGEVLGIIGPNGAGKTTVFELISGFLPAEGGRVVLGGRDVTGWSPDARARRGLGRSFQDARLFPAMTVEQCIAVALDRWVAVRDPLQAALHLPAVFDAEAAVRTRVDELVDLLGLGAFRSKFVHELSTGSRRIVDLACLVAHRPTVILLDEPSSGIAQRETEALAPVIERIRAQVGASIVVIEHDMPLVTAVADRLLALDLGRVLAAGTSGEVLAHPEVVASYLGTSEAVINRSGSRAGAAGAATAGGESR